MPDVNEAVVERTAEPCGREGRLSTEPEATGAQVEVSSRGALDAALHPILICDREGMILRASRGAHLLVGCDPVLQQFDTVFPLYRREAGASVKFSLENVIRGQGLAEAPFTLRLTNERHLDVLLCAAPLLGSHEQPDGCVVGISDVSGLAEHARRSEESLQLALDAGRMGAWHWDIATGRVTWTKVLEGVHGLAPGEFGGTFQDFQRDIHPEDTPRVLAAIDRAVRERSDYQIEYRIVRRDGETVWLEARGRLFLDAAGRPEHMAGVCADITPRKRADDRLRESESRLRAVVETAVDGIIAIDERGNIQTANPAVERIFGYAAAELIGQNVSILMPAPYNSAHDGYIARYLRTGEKRIIGIGRDVAGRRKDGSVFPLYLAVSETLLNGRRIFIGIGRDISERKRAEAALASQAQQLEEQARELARSNAELEQFASVVAHDLRSPLSAISLCAQYIARKNERTFAPDSAEMVKTIQNSVMHMDGLITRLLAYSRLGAGGITPARCDCEGLLQQLLATLQPQIQETGGKISHDPLPTIMADEMLLSQVFQNLVENSLKYHRPGVPPQVHISARDNGDEWIFLVRDNGLGIDPKNFDKVFLIFQRLHDDGSEYAGNGIGLAACKKIVERHGGRIWLDSQPGAGSTFHFSILKPPT